MRVGRERKMKSTTFLGVLALATIGQSFNAKAHEEYEPTCLEHYEHALTADGKSSATKGESLVGWCAVTGFACIPMLGFFFDAAWSGVASLSNPSIKKIIGLLEQAEIDRGGPLVDELLAEIREKNPNFELTATELVTTLRIGSHAMTFCTSGLFSWKDFIRFLVPSGAETLAPFQYDQGYPRGTAD